MPKIGDGQLSDGALVIVEDDPGNDRVKGAHLGAR
jgi:hypothetical protein